MTDDKMNATKERFRLGLTLFSDDEDPRDPKQRTTARAFNSSGEWKIMIRRRLNKVLDEE